MIMNFSTLWFFFRLCLKTTFPMQKPQLWAVWWQFWQSLVGLMTVCVWEDLWFMKNMGRALWLALHPKDESLFSSMRWGTAKSACSVSSNRYIFTNTQHYFPSWQCCIVGYSILRSVFCCLLYVHYCSNIWVSKKKMYTFYLARIHFYSK